MNVGIVGLGRMGSRIAQRLAETGFSVAGWDIHPATMHNLEGTEIAKAPDARAIAERAQIIISCITEDHGVREVYTGAGGFLEADVSGKLFVEMSTLQPETARILGPMLEARGARMVDSPVLGTLSNIPSGTLQALVGGRAEDVERARVVLDPLAHRVLHMGPLGCGYAMKLVANLGLAAYVEMLAEALAMGEGAGLSLAAMLGVMTESITANDWIARRKGVVSGEADDVTLDIRTLRKDVMSALATGSKSGVPMPLTAGTLSALSAAVASGWGDRDIGKMPQFSREAFVQRYER